MSFDRPFRLHLIHFNDLHGRLADVTSEACRPVFSRIAGFIKHAREACAGRSDEGVLVLSGGDDLVGTAFAELAGSRPEQFRCHPAFRLYSAAGVDACVIGNHDLDWSLRMLALAASRDANFPLLSANLHPASWAEPSAVQPYAILTVKGLRVGVIGVTTTAEIKRLFPGEFELTDPIAAVRDLLPAVHGECDLVIVLSHLGHTIAAATAVVRDVGDAQLAVALPDGIVTVIVGSHTHAVLNEACFDPANLVNRTAIVQAGCRGLYLGQITFDVTADGARITDARLWPVDALPEDPEFESMHVQPLAIHVQQLLRERIGVVETTGDPEPACGAAFGSGESALANFVADALAARCRAAGIPVDFAMVDCSSLADGLPGGGELTYGDLFRVAPYADSVMLLRLPADRLQALLDDNARRVDLPGEDPRAVKAHEERGFLQFSREVRYRIEGGERHERGELHATQVTVNGIAAAQLADARHEPLVVACSSFVRQLAIAWEREAMARGQEFLDLEAVPHEVTGLALREELVAYARQMGGVTEAAGLLRDGRVSGP